MPKQNRSKIPIEFIVSQLEQTIETFRTQLSLLVQLVTFLVLADVTLVGYALTVKISSVILLGSIIPFVIIYFFRRMSKLMLPVVYTAINLEDNYGNKEFDWLATTFIAHSVSPDFLDELRRIAAIKDIEQRYKLLACMNTPLVGTGRGWLRVLLFSIGLGQIVVPIILTLFFKWPFV